MILIITINFLLANADLLKISVFILLDKTSTGATLHNDKKHIK